MNYTDDQIRLAGFVQPDEGPRDFNSVLDLQGEGTRVLDQYIAQVEAEEGDCCADLGIAENTIGALITENDDLQQEIVDLGGENEDLQLTLDAMRDALADQFGVDYVLTGYITGTQNGVDWWASRMVGFTEQDGGEELRHSTVDTQTSAGFPLSQVPGMVIYIDGLTGPANGVTFNTVRPPNHTPGVPANFTVSGKLQTWPPGGFSFGPEDRFTWKYFGGA